MKKQTFINSNFQDKQLLPTNGTLINTSKCKSSRFNSAIGCLILFALLFIGGCVLQDNQNIPKNYSPQTNQSVTTNQTPSVQNLTNSTPVIAEPPKPVLLPITDKFAIYVLDNQEKGSYILTLNKKSMLINAVGGSDGLRTLKIIKNLGIINLDKLILTNSIDANIAGAPQMILREKPEQLIHSGIPSSSGYYKDYLSLYPNSTIVPNHTTFDLDDAIINLVVPYDDGQPLTGDNSILVQASYGKFNFLFSSDCAVDCESRVSNIKSDILLSNGGCDSLSLTFLKEVSPDTIIFSGTPCAETLERAKSLAIPVLVTSKDGDIVITSDGITYEYKNLKSK